MPAARRRNVSLRGSLRWPESYSGHRTARQRTTRRDNRVGVCANHFPLCDDRCASRLPFAKRQTDISPLTHTLLGRAWRTEREQDARAEIAFALERGG